MEEKYISTIYVNLPSVRTRLAEKGKLDFFDKTADSRRRLRYLWADVSRRRIKT